MNSLALFVGVVFVVAGIALIGTWLPGPHVELLARAAIACLGLILIGVGFILVIDLFR